MRYLASLTLLVACTAAALAANGPKTDLRGHAGGIVDLALHPDGLHLISISTEPAIFIWSLKTGRKVDEIAPRGKTVDRDTSVFNFSRRVESIAFGPEGKTVAEAAIQGGKGVVQVWDFETRKLVRTLAADARNVRAIAIAPDQKLLAANMRDGQRTDHKISLFDLTSGRTVGELRGDRLAATKLAFSPDGKTLVSAGGRQIHVWDVATRQERHAISTHKKTILALATSPDNQHFATADADDEVRIWDAATGKLVSEIEHKQDEVQSLAYSRTGKTIATGGKDGTIKLWSTKGRLRDTLWGHADRVTTLQFAGDNKHLASGARDGIIAWWNFEEPDSDPDEEDDPLDDENWRDAIPE